MIFNDDIFESEVYRQFCKNLRQECNDKVSRGKLTQDESDFEYYMRRDEVLF